MAAFLLLGVVAPLAVMKIEDRVGTRESTRGRRFMAISGAFGAGSLAMVSVLMSVFIFPAGGLIALAAYILVALAVPILVAGRGEPGTVVRHEPGRPTRLIGNAVSAVTRRRAIVLPVVVLMTIGAVLMALRVQTEFDVKDFFAEDTDFVVGLDRLDLHGGAQAGEPTDIYVNADLTDPTVVASVRTFISDFESLDSTRFGQDTDGVIEVQPGVIGVIDDVWSSPAAQGAIAQISGVTLTDDDGDGVPDSREQLVALYEVTRSIAVPFDAQNLIRTPDGVRSACTSKVGAVRPALTVGRARFATRRSHRRRPGRRRAVDDRLRSRSASARPQRLGRDDGWSDHPPGSHSMRSRGRSRSASPIAVFVCFLIAAGFMRSLKYGAVVIVPILIVVSWLYGFMYLFGYSINLVTATIGAVSIGIGIDFAIHFAVRFREELAQRGSRTAAVQAAGEGTGVALVASAASSVAGFAVLALAPMPLFASYGFLTRGHDRHGAGRIAAGTPGVG